MKKTMIGFTLLASLASFSSLQADVDRVKLSVLGKYIDVSTLLRKALFLGKSPSNEAIIDMIVNALKVGELPIVVDKDPSATVQDYFDTSKAKEFIKNVLTDLANQNLSSEKLGSYLGILRAGIFKGKKGIPDTIGQEEAHNCVLFLDNLREYLSSGVYKEVSLFDFIDANNGIPKFLNNLIQGYFDLKGAQPLIENPSQISVGTIFHYISFEPLFRDKANKQQLSEGLKLSIEDLIKYIGKPEKSATDFVKLLRTLI